MFQIFKSYSNTKGLNFKIQEIYSAKYLEYNQKVGLTIHKSN